MFLAQAVGRHSLVGGKQIGLPPDRRTTLVSYQLVHLLVPRNSARPQLTDFACLSVCNMGYSGPTRFPTTIERRCASLTHPAGRAKPGRSRGLVSVRGSPLLHHFLVRIVVRQRVGLPGLEIPGFFPGGGGGWGNRGGGYGGGVAVGGGLLSGLAPLYCPAIPGFLQNEQADGDGGEGSGDPLDGLRSKGQPGSPTGSGTRLYDMPGGAQGRDEDFDSLPGESVDTVKEGIKVKTLPNGRKAISLPNDSRPGSNGGTIEVQTPGGRPWDKFRC